MKIQEDLFGTLVGTGGKVKVTPHTEAEIGLPAGEVFTLTRSLIDACRVNRTFTVATMKAFGFTEMPEDGWISRLVGKVLTREQYRSALEGRFIFRDKFGAG
jgi:hypothetical protein